MTINLKFKQLVTVSIPIQFYLSDKYMPVRLKFIISHSSFVIILIVSFFYWSNMCQVDMERVKVLICRLNIC